jgi:hypothetical protein
MRIIDLVERTGGLGHELPRMSISSIESGARESITLAEVFVLATALDVSPMALLAPDDDQVEVSPGRWLPADEARAWISGAQPPPPSRTVTITVPAGAEITITDKA